MGNNTQYPRWLNTKEKRRRFAHSIAGQLLRTYADGAELAWINELTPKGLLRLRAEFHELADRMVVGFERGQSQPVDERQKVLPFCDERDT